MSSPVMPHHAADTSCLALQSADALDEAHRLADLSQDKGHVIGQILDGLVAQAGYLTQTTAQVRRGPIVVDATQNYDALGIGSDSRARESLYARWVSPDTLLRTHTSGLVPDLLRAHSASGSKKHLLLVVPGLVWRRDLMDRTHVGTPHQADLWWVAAPGSALPTPTQWLSALAAAACPGAKPDLLDAVHPYTTDGLEMSLPWDGRLLEVGEGGRISPDLLARCGLEGWSGLASGVGLDRLAMVRKSLPDIRLLRHPDPRIRKQMGNLASWRPVSMAPAIRRDLSVVLDERWDAETLGDRLREALATRPDLHLDWIEEVVWKQSWTWEEVPAAARSRLGMKSGQLQVLVGLTLRSSEGSIRKSDADHLAREVALLIHDGSEPPY